MESSQQFPPSSLKFPIIYVILSPLCIGPSPSGKAQDFDSCTRGFESRRPSYKKKSESLFLQVFQTFLSSPSEKTHIFRVSNLYSCFPSLHLTCSGSYIPLFSPIYPLSSTSPYCTGSYNFRLQLFYQHFQRQKIPQPPLRDFQGGYRDSNPGPPEPQSGALTNCAIATITYEFRNQSS